MGKVLLSTSHTSQIRGSIPVPDCQIKYKKVTVKLSKTESNISSPGLGYRPRSM